MKLVALLGLASSLAVTASARGETPVESMYMYCYSNVQGIAYYTRIFKVPRNKIENGSTFTEGRMINPYFGYDLVGSWTKQIEGDKLEDNNPACVGAGSKPELSTYFARQRKKFTQSGSEIDINRYASWYPTDSSNTVVEAQDLS